ncbi:hypothetical protein [Streptomyces sp. NPDC051636]|uniref:hypothetical protein n=1 Tax=Streptomyces sp. NPDC051636 TaxID=3365663 RepID=UPI0037888C46
MRGDAAIRTAAMSAATAAAPAGPVTRASAAPTPVVATTGGRRGAGEPVTLSACQGERAAPDGEELPAGPTPAGGSIPRAERGTIQRD